MKCINIVYFNNYSDVSIVCVPDVVAENLYYHDGVPGIIQQFFDYVWEHEESFMVELPNGQKVCSADTVEFIWYLNNIYLNSLGIAEQASLVADHVQYRPEYIAVDF